MWPVPMSWSLDVEAGAERSISAALFKMQGESLQSYATKNLQYWILWPESPRTVELTVSRLETAVLDLVVRGRRAGNDASAAMIDRETGFHYL